MIVLALPWALLLLPLPWLSKRWLPERHLRRHSLAVPALTRLEALTQKRAGLGAVVLAKPWIHNLVLWIFWGLAVLALAQPKWIGEPITRNVPTQDLLLAVDLSGSMEARDFQRGDGEVVDRLTAVKDVLDDYLVDLEGVRVGLIFFGSAAFVQTPFTEDVEVCRRLLDEAQVRMAGPQTVLGDAIGLAITMFERSELDQRVMILLTDGNDTGSKVPPEEAAKVATERGITLHTVAMGDPTATGEDQLDEATLKSIAERTGGTYALAMNSAQLEATYRRIDELETREAEVQSHRPEVSLFHWPLAAGFVLAMVLQALRAGLFGGLVTLVGSATLGLLLWRISDSEGFFLRPYWLVALLPLAWLIWRSRGGSELARHWRESISPELLRHLVVGADASGAVGPLGWLCATSFLVGVALAGPSWRMEPSPFTEDRATIVAVLEVTPSMESRDLPPSRLRRGVQKLEDLFRARPDASVALVAYAGSAHMVMPPTSDAELVLAFARALTPEVLPRGGDDPAAALRLAREELVRGELAGSIVWLTDGVPAASLGDLEALAEERGAPTHVLGLCAEGSERDSTRAAADALSAGWVSPTHDDADVRKLAGDLTASFEASRRELGGSRRRDEGYWLLLPILLMSLMFFRAGWIVSHE